MRLTCPAQTLRSAQNAVSTSIATIFPGATIECSVAASGSSRSLLEVHDGNG